ncbi:unnamed protein product [Chrysoparadoxa australica]
MQPVLNPHLESDTSEDGDIVWLNRMSFSSFEKGDIVVFTNPFDPEERCVKRLIAVDGEWVRPRGNTDRALELVPRGHCWVEGDNSDDSEDSSSYGPIPLALLEAKASAVVWPPSRVGVLKRVEFSKFRHSVM